MPLLQTKHQQQASHNLLIIQRGSG